MEPFIYFIKYLINFELKFSRQFSRLLGTSCSCITLALSPYSAHSLCIIYFIIVIPDLRVTTSWHYKYGLAKQKMLLLVLVATDIREYYEYWSSGLRTWRSHNMHCTASVTEYRKYQTSLHFYISLMLTLQ